MEKIMLCFCGTPFVSDQSLQRLNLAESFEVFAPFQDLEYRYEL